jgi:acetolactate synthase-1/2/3 large subunit
MRAALPDDGIFVNELTQVGYLSRIAFPIYSPNTYIGPTYQGTLGYGFPTALGAAVGGEGRRVLSITGDGGFGWNLQELATARKYNLPVTLVVFNDGYFGNVRAIQKRVFGSEKEFAVRLENPDFLTLAAAFRVPAVRADSPAALQAAVTDSLRENGPVLIEVPVGEMPSPWPLLRLQPMPGVSAPDAGPHPLTARN